MKIVEIDQDVENDWNEYVLNHYQSTFYHQFGWRYVVEQSYGHTPIYLVAMENKKIVGVFPIFLMKSLFFGKKLISIPFGSYGGPLADNKEIYAGLIKRGKKIAEENKVKFLEIRANPNFININNNNFLITKNQDFVTSILELYDNVDKMWRYLKKNKRKTITKSEKVDQYFTWDSKIDNFYQIYSTNMHDLGTPVHSKNFFKNLLKIFPNNVKIQIIIKEDKIIYSAFYIIFKDSTGIFLVS